MLAVMFALIAFLAWGIGDIFGGTVARKIGGYSSALWSYILSIIFSSFYIPFALDKLQGITLETVIWLLVLTPIGMIPLITLYEGIKRGNASLAGTIAGAYGTLVVVLSIIFLGERISLAQGILIIVIFFGLLLSSVNFKTLKIKQLLSDKGVPFAIISLITWGIYFTFVKVPIKNIGWFWPTYLAWWGFPLVFIYMRLKSIKLEFPKSSGTWLSLGVAALLLTTGLFANSLAMATGKASIVIPIASSYPILFAVLAYFVFKDRLSKQQIIGITTVLCGIILLSFSS